MMCVNEVQLHISTQWYHQLYATQFPIRNYHFIVLIIMLFHQHHSLNAQHKVSRKYAEECHQTLIIPRGMKNRSQASWEEKAMPPAIVETIHCSE